MFKCLTSEKTFSTYYNLNQHMKIHSGEKLQICDICLKSFGRKSVLRRHFETHNTDGQSTLKCDQCEQVFTRKDNLKHHLKSYQNLIYPYRGCGKMFEQIMN